MVFAIHWYESAMDLRVLPILNPPPTSLPIPSLWVILVPPALSTCLMHQTWTGDLFHNWKYTCFNAILSDHPTLAFSHRVQKSVLYICDFFCLAYRVIVTIFLNSIYSCIRVFSSYSKQGLLFTVVNGLLIEMTSLVPKQKLWVHGLQ